MRSISLKSKVVLGNVAVAILVLVVASSIQMHFMRQDMSRLLSDQQFALVTREAQDLDTKFETDRDVLVRLAKGFPLTELQSPSATRAYFLARPALLATFDDMLVLDTAGDLIADLPQAPQRPGLTDADRADFRKLQATLQVVVTEPAAQASHGEPGLKIMVPMMSEDHRLAGVLIGVLRLENRNLVGSLGEARVGKSGVFVLLTKTTPALYLAGPQKQMILKPRPSQGDQATSRALKDFEGTVEDDSDARARNLSSFKSLKTLNWLLMAVVPLDEVYAPIDRAEHRTWQLTLTVCAVILPLSWVVAWLMLNPLSHLRRDIDFLRRGGLRQPDGERTPKYLHRDDEIGDVARSLYRLIDERSAAAASQQAAERQSREAAESASRAMSDFLARMSHEVRTPMIAVLGLTELLLDTELNSEQRDYVETILSSGRALLAITNDVLDLSKIDAGKLEIEVIPYDPVRTLKDVVALFAPQAAALGLVLEAQIAPDVPCDLMGDPGHLRQVLCNLIGNSLKFTAAGSVRIGLRATARDGGEITLEFSVIDTGIGMTGDQQTLLFRPYSQAEASTSRRFGGTGLGLSISLKLVALMGGTFEVVSAPGHGSTFTFTVRCGAAEPGAALPVAMKRVVARQRFTGRVLLVEDNIVNIKVARATLKGLGLEVLVAENGLMALDLLARERVDLVLMDMNMPVMDGIEATRRIRASELAGELAGRRPIIAMTANVLREATDACLAAGMDGFIPKPSDRAQIVAMLAQWLRADVVAAPDPPSPTAAPGGDAIDLATYRRVEDAMGAEMALLVAEFTSSTEHLIRDIGAAALRQDAQTVKFRAHTLRSSSASVGALDLSRLAADLEAGVSVAQFADWQTVAPTLQSEFARVVPALQRLSRAASVDLPDANTPQHGGALPAPSNSGTAAAAERAKIAS